MKVLSLIALLLASSSVFSQKVHWPSDHEISTAPEWAQEMYSENPNVFEVDRDYSEYYKTNTFKKNYHTQYYKKWRRSVRDYVGTDGYVSDLIKEEIQLKAMSHTRNKSKAGAWSVIGPMQVYDQNGNPDATQTNVYSLGQCSSNPLIMYCGTEPGEIYKTVDGGSNWFNVSYNLVTNNGITAAAVHPNNPDIALLGGGDDLFLTTDGGSSWTTTLSTSALYPSEIFINPVNPDTIIVTGDVGLWITDNGGASWSNVYSDPTYDIKANPENPNKLYMLADNGSDEDQDLFISTDGGFSWVIQTLGWYSSSDPDKSCHGGRLAVSEADTSRVYAYLIGESKAGDVGYIGLWRSDDGGYNWTNPIGQVGGPYSAGIPNLARGSDTWDYHQGFYNCAIMANNANADEIVIGGLNMWRSNDAGVTFECVHGYQCSNYDMHVDMQDFRAFGNQYWATTDGGIYFSSDFFNTQPSVVMNGIHGSEFWGFGSGWNEDLLVGGLYHNGNNAYYQNYAAGDFLHLGGGEAPTGYVNPSDERKAYFSDVGGKIIPLNIGDPIANASFGTAPNESYWSAQSSELEFHPNCYNIMFLGKDNQILKSVDGGALFTVIYSGVFGAVINYIEISRQYPDKQYAILKNGNTCYLIKTTDGWATSISQTLPITTGRALIALDPLDDEQIWLALPSGSNGNKVYSSSNGGANWTNITSPILDGESIHSLVHIGGTDGGLYAGTNVSVYYTSNTIGNWVIDDAGLPAKMNTNILRPFYRDGKIRMASYNSGIWESSLYESPTNPIATIMVNELNTLCDADTFHFDCHSMLNHTGATWDWTFENGHISTSNLRNPSVQFNGTGTHMVTLTVTNAGGNSSTDTIYIDVSSPSHTNIQEDFETSFPPTDWKTDSQGGIVWEHTNTAGGFGTSSSCMYVNNFDHYAWGEYCEIVIPVDMSSVSDGLLSWDVAYARYSGANKDSLEVVISDDCGQSWTSVYFGDDNTLPTAPDYSAGLWVPSATEWRRDTVDISAWAGNENIRIGFRNHGGYGQALYVDNINLDDNIFANFGDDNQPYFSVYPNPANAQDQIYIKTSDNGKIIFSLFTAEGNLKTNNIQDISEPINLEPLHLANGMYMYTVRTENFFYKGKIMIKK